MHTVVTGAAGFIGSNLVRALNARGLTDIWAVDDLTDAAKVRNLVDCEIADYFDKDEFLARLTAGDFDDQIAAVLHQGACSDTLETDGRYMLRNNYRYSVTLLDHCQDNDIPLLYASSASVYGAGRTFAEKRECEAPLNVYGYSKWLFDQYVRRTLPERTVQIAGFRYFNVYGLGEQHKGRMASVALHFFNQYREEGRVRLFEGSGGYGPGEQQRDFVFVDDVVAVNLHFLDHPEKSGIYNVGSGAAESFNSVAVVTVNACRAMAGEPPLTLAELLRQRVIEYIPFPKELVDKYQNFTQADLTALRASGYAPPMRSAQQAVPRYVESLIAAARSHP